MQLSDTEGLGRLRVAKQSPGFVFAVMFAGQMMIGFSLSTTVTVAAQVAELPAASVTVKTTTVTPIGKEFPEGDCEKVNAPGQLSEADGLLRLTKPLQSPGAVFTVKLEGQTTVGGVKSGLHCAKTEAADNQKQQQHKNRFRAIGVRRLGFFIFEN